MTRSLKLERRDCDALGGFGGASIFGTSGTSILGGGGADGAGGGGNVDGIGGAAICAWAEKVNKPQDNIAAIRQFAV